jgi:hypothetical protein
MDLLDPIRQEARDEAQTDRVGLLEPEGGEAPSLLLAGMPASRQCIEIMKPPPVLRSSAGVIVDLCALS